MLGMTMKRLFCLITLLLAPQAQAGEITGHCRTSTDDSRQIFCQAILGPAADFRGDPVLVVTTTIRRLVTDVLVSAQVSATDCGRQIELRNTAGLGTSAAGQMARFNWPVSLQNAMRRCVQVIFDGCRYSPADGGQSARCNQVMSGSGTTVIVRW